MNSIALRTSCVVLGLQCAVAFAQDADSATRVQRDAANPLRMIIEAGKLKPRKGGDGDPAATAAAEAKATPPKVAPAKIAAAAPQIGTLADIATPELAALTAELPAAVAPVAFVPPAAPQAAEDDAGAAPPLPKDGLAALGLPSPGSAAEPKAAATPGAAAQSPRVALQLADYVEPQLPERLRRRLQSDGEVVLDFTVNPDGSVGDLSVRSASDKALEAIAVDAVRQWRYRPIAAAQAHGVQLVFKRE